jgi:hypothetical protein
MLRENRISDQEISLSKAPRRVFDYLFEKHDKVCSSDELAEQVYGVRAEYLNLRESKLTVRNYINRCRDALRFSSADGTSIYSISCTGSYIFTNTRDVGKWISLPYTNGLVETSFSSEEESVLRQCFVRDDKRLTPRLTREQHKLLWFLAERELVKPGQYVRSREIAMSLFNFCDDSELKALRELIFMARDRLKDTNIYIENDPEFNKNHFGGYRIVRKATSS